MAAVTKNRNFFNCPLLRTHFLSGVTQGPFHQSLVAIGPVVSEEKIKM
jgi:hypothetical protein